MEDPVKLAALALKVEQLVKTAGSEWRFRHHKVNKKERVWEITGSYVRNSRGGWFRVALENVLIGNDPLFTQAIVLEEASNFNIGECNKVVGEMMLPLRMVDGRLMFGLECRKMVGAYGASIITAPRRSSSDPKQLPRILPQQVAHEAKVRLNANRLTGMINSQIVYDREEQFQNCVWLDEEELYELLSDNRICDSGTRDLAWWALMHREELTEKFG